LSPVCLYTRDPTGNITGITEGDTSAAYHYDALYRLTGTEDASGTLLESYTYNRIGDRLSKTGSSQATGTYGYQTNTHWLTRIGNDTRSYDANGNTIGATLAGEAWDYGYDHRNRLTTVQYDGGIVATYTYNAFGERIAKDVTTPQTIHQRFVYNEGSQLIAEYGSTNRDYLWLGALPIAAIDIDGSVDTARYVTADALNTPRVIADANGAVVWSWPINGNPLGEKLPTSTAGYVYNLRFPGQYFDIETGLDYNGARYYDSVRGGYDQPDPIGQRGGLGLYVYGLNSPLRYSDPSGLFPNPLEATCLDPLQPVCWGGIALDLETTAAVVGGLSSSDHPSVQLAKPKPGAKPKDCPAGTRPIDQFPGLSKDDVHNIKDGVNAGPRDWTGITPDGNVITGDNEGNAVDNGPMDIYLPGGRK
jgi:RHS repeat-associated protein